MLSSPMFQVFRSEAYKEDETYRRIVMYNKVTKRDGKVVDFDIQKIADAIRKAFDATNTEYNDSIIDFLALKTTADFQSKVKNGAIAVEDIQDSVETVLSRGGYEQVAKAYILYRKQREKLRNSR